MSLPSDLQINTLDDVVLNTIPQTMSNSIQLIPEDIKQTYIPRNASGVLELDTTSNKIHLAVPLTIDVAAEDMYIKLINTSFEYFVDEISILDTLPAEEQERVKFFETYYDNDWVSGSEIGYLVPSPTKFKAGDIINVNQFPGALVPEYSGVFEVTRIVRSKKVINGVTYDAVQTTCPYIKNTPVNGGTITLF